MGIVKLFSRLLMTWIAFLYPAFASYKALSHRPVSEPDLERWVKYWTIVGVYLGAEYLLEWLVSWLPFYWEVKTAAVLYLALPQTQGSTYIYDRYLGPYFQRNEVSFDRNIKTAQTSIVPFAKERARALIQFVWNAVTQAKAQVSFDRIIETAQTSIVPFVKERAQALIQFVWNAVTQAQAQVRLQQEANADPATAPPAGSPAAVVSNLWKTYGSSIITGISRAANTAQGDEMNVAAAARASGSQPQPSPSLNPRTPYTSDE